MKPAEHSDDDCPTLAGVQARAWLVRLHSGSATVEDVRQFRAWRGAAGANETAYRDVLAMWHALPAALADTAVQSGGRQSRAVTRRQWLTGAGATAAVAIVSTTLLVPTVPAGATVVETAKGERKRVAFADGVAIELNTDSRIWTRVTDGLREVQLVRGETVLATEDQAVIARCGDSEVRAESARFVMLATPDGSARVTCLAGAVIVRVGAAPARKVSAGRGIAPANGVVTPVSPAEAEEALAWRRGVLVFRDRPAREVVAELNRYRPGRVLLSDQHGAVAISGVIHIDRADAAVDHLARSMGLSVVRLPGNIVLLRG